VTLHVCYGALVELEIWTGTFGEAALPEPAGLRFEDRLPVRLQYALAEALVERLRPLVPAQVELSTTITGDIAIRVRGGDVAAASGFGDLQGAAQSLLASFAFLVSDRLDEAWPPNADPDRLEARAERVGDELRLRYETAGCPALALRPIPDAELDRLSGAWSVRFGELGR